MKQRCSRWLRRAGFIFSVVMLLAVVPGMFGRTVASCSGYDELLVQSIDRCPRAHELLGDDVGPAVVGLSCGSTETGGGTGTASWMASFSGSRDRGTLSYDAEEHGGEWSLTRAHLDVNGETIDLLACAPQPDAPATAGRDPKLAHSAPDAVHSSFDGKVLHSTHPEVATSTRCEGTLVRERANPTARVIVHCGTQVVYDGRGAFALDVGDPARDDDDAVSYDDAQTSDQDETPACQLVGKYDRHGGSGTLVISDVAHHDVAGYEITIAL